MKDIFKLADKNGDGVLDKEELYDIASKNTVLRSLIEESVKNVKKIDKIIQNDLEEPFKTWVPISANL